MTGRHEQRPPRRGRAATAVPGVPVEGRDARNTQPRRQGTRTLILGALPPSTRSLRPGPAPGARLPARPRETTPRHPGPGPAAGPPPAVGTGRRRPRHQPRHDTPHPAGRHTLMNSRFTPPTAWSPAETTRGDHIQDPSRVTQPPARTEPLPSRCGLGPSPGSRHIDLPCGPGRSTGLRSAWAWCPGRSSGRAQDRVMKHPRGQVTARAGVPGPRGVAAQPGEPQTGPHTPSYPARHPRHTPPSPPNPGQPSHPPQDADVMATGPQYRTATEAAGRHDRGRQPVTSPAPRQEGHPTAAQGPA
jgi:hypothetical protein